ncbi:11412_t:CDS:2, partial [Funneliformis caledonium]
LVNEAKLEDIPKGVAQNIMQVYSASEASVNACKSESPLFGIVTIEIIWHFIRWISSPEKSNKQKDALKNNSKRVHIDQSSQNSDILD